jgi:hypothetical protein
VGKVLGEALRATPELRRYRRIKRFIEYNDVPGEDGYVLCAEELWCVGLGPLSF